MCLNQLDPLNNFDKYSVPPDIYHHMSIAAEIGNHGPAIYPYIAGSGVALQYHWGSFSLGSFLSAGGLIPLAIAMYRLEFILLSFLLLALLFFTGKFVGKSNLSGVVASLFGVLTLYPNQQVVKRKNMLKNCELNAPNNMNYKLIWQD